MYRGGLRARPAGLVLVLEQCVEPRGPPDDQDGWSWTDICSAIMCYSNITLHLFNLNDLNAVMPLMAKWMI